MDAVRNRRYSKEGGDAHTATNLLLVEEERDGSYIEHSRALLTKTEVLISNFAAVFAY